MLFYEGTVEDITAERATRPRWRWRTERRTDALTEKAQGLTLVCDRLGVVRYASPASRMLLGRAPEAVTGCLGVRAGSTRRPGCRARRSTRSSTIGLPAGGERCASSSADGSWRHLAALANTPVADDAVAGVVLNRAT